MANKTSRLRRRSSANIKSDADKYRTSELPVPDCGTAKRGDLEYLLSRLEAAATRRFKRFTTKLNKVSWRILAWYDHFGGYKSRGSFGIEKKLDECVISVATHLKMIKRVKGDLQKDGDEIELYDRRETETYVAELNADTAERNANTAERNISAADTLVNPLWFLVIIGFANYYIEFPPTWQVICSLPFLCLFLVLFFWHLKEVKNTDADREEYETPPTNP